ncbi:PIG-L family deacetylase [Rhizobacter sp. AJA081-3]|uniref:PIG-L deacetylase family protein n=1 Tax=Rhizobacter sp. AJA081-3 TaxID=2753607 RepID=UPI001AE00B30|nr:PIG-L deacetylase family protein [Rhizobacter sp. AJA081-3]QTN24269.1 PIG-L family deacetylase [Rhizobacter sp. AJA081-3]
MSTILVVAPHPDDETLGCGGTLLRAIAAGAEVHWAIASTMAGAPGFDAARLAPREREIEQVAAAYGFAGLHRAPFPATRVDTVPIAERVDWFARVVASIRPDTLYLPHPQDAHSDHAAVYEAAAACTKSFRYPSVRHVNCYETLSETEFGLLPRGGGFRPNRFVDIAAQLERKLEIMALYVGEMGPPPFPRSVEAIRALACLRGGVAGTPAAEAFMVLRSIE